MLQGKNIILSLQGGITMKIRVLLVDDEEEFVEALAERLSMRDYDVTTSLRGEDALEKLRQYNFDVIILDVRMPGIGGNEVLHEIKRIKPLTEVIMLTGHATVESAIEGMKQGAYDYLIKPCETEDLVIKINKAYEKKAEHEERIRDAKVKEIISSPRAALRDD
jgi:DNA-binding NtrC family response regulator